MGEVVPLRTSRLPANLTVVGVDLASGPDTVTTHAIAAPPVTREHRLEAALLLAEAGLKAAKEALDICDDYRPIFVRPSLVAKIERGLAACEKATRDE